MANRERLIDLHLAAMTAEGLSTETRRVRRIVLEAADASPELEYGIEAAEAAEVIAYLGRQWSDNTRATYAYHLRQFYAWAARTEYVDVDISTTLPIPPKRRTGPRPLTDDQVDFALARLDDPVLTCVTLATYVGLRCCEIAEVYREDITQRVVSVRGKGGDVAACGNHAHVWAIVEQLPRGRVIESVGGRADAAWVSRTVRHSLRRIGLRASAHQLRHTCATRMRRNGADLFAVQRQMRHRSIQSTQIYAGVSDDELYQAVNRVPGPPGRRRQAGVT